MKVELVSGQTTFEEINALNPMEYYFLMDLVIPLQPINLLMSSKKISEKYIFTYIWNLLRSPALGLALGAKTQKMNHGHHGANHPVLDLSTGKVEITSMNHGFCN